MSRLVYSYPNPHFFPAIPELLLQLLLPLTLYGARLRAFHSDQVYFNEATGGRYVPRAVLMDLEPGRGKWYRTFLHGMREEFDSDKNLNNTDYVVAETVI